MATTTSAPPPSWGQRVSEQGLPIAVVLLFTLALWYALTVYLNAPGAIERVRVDPQTLEPRFKVIGCDRWSNEEGFEEAVAASGVTGICGSGIIEILAELYLAGVIRHDGVIDGALAARNPRIQSDGRTVSYQVCAARQGARAIKVTQNDVRAIQLGKAALPAKNS